MSRFFSVSTFFADNESLVRMLRFRFRGASFSQRLGEGFWNLFPAFADFQLNAGSTAAAVLATAALAEGGLGRCHRCCAPLQEHAFLPVVCRIRIRESMNLMFCFLLPVQRPQAGSAKSLRLRSWERTEPNPKW